MPARPEVHENIEALTPRQREVLGLVARGLTNGQIADHLGITLDGAKYHVSEIITRLGVSSRDEAAAYWRAEQSLGARSRRWVLSLPLRPLLAGGAAVVGVSVAVVVSVVLLAGGNEPLAPDSTASPTAEPTPASTAEATSTAVPGVPTVVGLFTEPRPTAVTQERPLPAQPESPFPPHDGETVVLYDTVAVEYWDYGPGLFPQVAPGGQFMAWTTDDGDRVADIPGGVAREIDLSSSWWGWDGDLILLQGQGAGEFVHVDPRTDERSPAQLDDPDSIGKLLDSRDGVEIAWLPAADFAAWQVQQSVDREALLRVQGIFVSLAGEREIILGVSDQPTCQPSSCTANVFLADVDTGQSTFVVSVLRGAGGTTAVANDSWIVWTENYCGMPPDWQTRGTTKAMDRRTGEVFDLGEPLWPDGFTPDGRLRVLSDGAFARALFDLEQWRFDVVLPEGGAYLSWSDDHRFAAIGAMLGHGGQCS